MKKQKHICGWCQKEFDSVEKYEDHFCNELHIKPKNRHPKVAIKLNNKKHGSNI